MMRVIELLKIKILLYITEYKLKVHSCVCDGAYFFFYFVIFNLNFRFQKDNVLELVA